MDFIRRIEAFVPTNKQEAADKKAILSYCTTHKATVLLREDTIAHITSSGFLMNEQLDKVLLAHHNIRGVWAWTGGHADGDEDFLRVAIKEAMEETGVAHIAPLSSSIASLDILPVMGHLKNGQYVNTHLHLSVAYILICNETDAIRPRLSENTAVSWFPTSYFTPKHFSQHDSYLYNKLIQKALHFKQNGL